MNTKQIGFTLIELITVIMLVGILAVAVLPKFDGTASYEAHTHRAQLISALRLTQQRAMQQTNTTDGYCHQIVFEGHADYTRYGVPDRTDCDITTFPTPDPIEDWAPDATGHLVDSRIKLPLILLKTVQHFLSQRKSALTGWDDLYMLVRGGVRSM